jgi:RNA polymerase sigma-70 factor (ECF subfamily)
MEQRAKMADRLINEQVIEACQQGDRDAFRVLFETYKDKVFSVAVYSVGGDQSVAEDVTQQIFLKLFSVIGQFRGESEFTTWLYRLVVNQCLDERRKHKRLLPLGDAMSSPSGKKPQEKQYARLELAAAVRDAIGELKPAFRVPVLLKYIEGLSYEEIASVMGCSKGTVASRLNRAHAELARRLGHLQGQSVLED